MWRERLVRANASGLAVHVGLVFAALTDRLHPVEGGGGPAARSVAAIASPLRPAMPRALPFGWPHEQQPFVGAWAEAAAVMRGRVHEAFHVNLGEVFRCLVSGELRAFADGHVIGHKVRSFPARQRIAAVTRADTR